MSTMFNGASDMLPAGDAKLTKCDESTICPGLFLCGPQVRQDGQIFCFVYKYRQRFAVAVNEISRRLGLPEAEIKKAVDTCRKHHMFLDDLSCCEATCGADGAC
jgi:putative flavoprotein involved in K+ transport